MYLQYVFLLSPCFHSVLSPCPPPSASSIYPPPPTSPSAATFSFIISRWHIPKKLDKMFFDELDAIGGARFDDGVGGDNEVQCTMLEIVNQLDGFDL
ncbi:26S proteasome regulatory subunit 7 [Camellia lanceoleosa]|uniref:26S proteasome regulatory subunit 7 n=1 Tax=Camellia lanceoleosa TaxID=1840588 RepID=A0ACC0J4E8_9ERIC|nr:26S proteasome regulatory subunit 7 [Camellia lanceoleosa]